MSRIDDLIADLCPDGVEYAALSAVAGYSSARIDASELNETSFVGVDNLVADKGGRVDANYLPNTARLTAYYPGDVLLGNIRPYLKKIWLANSPGGCSGDVLAIHINKNARPVLIPEFLYYLMSSGDFFAYSMQHAKGAKMPRGDKAAILNYVIPLPPLEVQREIVAILDTFTELEAELEAELESRKRQYEYYRNALLRLDGKSGIKWIDDLCPDGVEFRRLGDLLGYEQPGKYLVSSSRYDDSYPTPVLTAGQTFVLGYTDEDDGVYSASKKRPVIIFDDFTTAFKWVDFPFKAKSSAMKMLQVKSTEHVSLRFAYYIMQTIKYSPQDHARQWISTYSNFSIPLPPLEVQREIVNVLDKFDALVNDLSIGLPAELAARRKQYEYYRDQLLTFKEAM